MLRGLAYWILGSIVTLVLFITAVVVYHLNGRNTNFPHIISRIWSKIILKVFCGVNLRVIGLEKIDRNKIYIIISNHRSNTDIFVATASIPLQFRWLAKKSLFKLPLIGYGMKICGYIPVEREKSFSAVRSLENVKKALEQNKSVWIFPEGTRTRKEELGTFKRGAFLIAKETNIPILPVVMYNTDKIFVSPLKIRPVDVYVEILDPVKFEDYLEKYGDERSAVRGMIEDLKRKMQKVYSRYESNSKK